MNIDLLPLAAFGLDPSPAAPRPIGEANTLTLRLDLTPVHPAFDSMSGSVGLGNDSCDHAPGLRAAVVPADGPGLTLTF